MVITSFISIRISLCVCVQVYERASQATSWFLLRYTAGLLGKRAGSLAKALTDILVLQKQVTVGLPPEPREIVIDAPLTPDQIAHVIQKACGEDSLMNVLTQVCCHIYLFHGLFSTLIFSSYLFLRIAGFVYFLNSILGDSS